MSHQQIVVSGRRRGPSLGAVGLTAIVLTWWLVVGAVVMQALSPPAQSAELTATAQASGSLSNVHLPGLRPAHVAFPVAVEHVAFDMARRGYTESDEEMILEAFATHEWIHVVHGQAVRVVSRHGGAVQVELIDGPHAGRRAWLADTQLAP